MSMTKNEFSWPRGNRFDEGSVLTAADIDLLRRLLSELRDITQSRSTHAAALETLRRLGTEADSPTPAKRRAASF
jgi:hypothetical protein